MRKEVEKFEFANNGGVSGETLGLEFVISKKRAWCCWIYYGSLCNTRRKTLGRFRLLKWYFFDSESKQSMGGVHFLVRDGCLTLPGINPSLEVLATVDREELFDKIILLKKFKKMQPLSHYPYPYSIQETFEVV